MEYTVVTHMLAHVRLTTSSANSSMVFSLADQLCHS